MRINIPKDGHIKIVRKFLLFPRKINHEIRWLEFAELKYVYREARYSYYGFISKWILDK